VNRHDYNAPAHPDGVDTIGQRSQVKIVFPLYEEDGSEGILAACQATVSGSINAAYGSDSAGIGYKKDASMATEWANPPPSPERPLNPKLLQELDWCEVQRTQARQSLLGSATTAWPCLSFEPGGALVTVPQNSWPMVTGSVELVRGCGVVVGMAIGPFSLSSQSGRGRWAMITHFIFVKIRAANTAPCYGDEGFVVVCYWFWDIDDADVANSKVLCCFHDIK
jgi:hypothetical protein